MPGRGADGDRILYGNAGIRPAQPEALAGILRDHPVECSRLIAGDACYWVDYHDFIGANEWAVWFGPSQFGDLGGLRTTPGGYRELGPGHNKGYAQMVENVKRRVETVGEDTLVRVEAHTHIEHDDRKCYFSGSGVVREASTDQMAFIEQNAAWPGSWMLLPGEEDWESDNDLIQFLIYWDEKNKNLIGYTSGWLL